MKCITLRNPWAGLLVLGIKSNETRSYNTKHRGLLAIHSSKLIDQAGYELLQWLVVNHEDFKPGSYNYKVCTETGSVLGIVNVTGSLSTNKPENIEQISDLERRFGNYDPDRHFWTCEPSEIFPEPFSAMGKQSFWHWERECVEV